jgi:methylenetetrahydrofolate--tRNA-(uracil-5-)-methyltransferase
VVHRNTYVNAPRLLTETFQTRLRGDLFFAGQIAGTEGYVESAAGGLLAGIYCAMMLQGEPIRTVPRTTALGALAFYISHARAIDYQPTNVTFGIIPELDRQVRGKKQRREAVSRRALEHLDAWILERGIER